MNREEIVRMAHDAGCGWAQNGTEPVLMGEEQITRFADLVAAAERDACAKILEKNVIVCKNNLMLQDVLNGSAAAIRARGEISKEE